MARDEVKAYSGLLAISRAIAGLTDGHAVLQTCASQFRTIVPHDHMDVALLVENGCINHVYEAWLKTDWSEAKPGCLLVSNSPIRAVFLGQEDYLLAADATVDARFHFPGADNQPILANRLRSRIHVPLRVRGAIIGAISISSHTPDVYDVSDVTCAQDCADILAPYFWALSRADEAVRAAKSESEAKSREEFLRVGALRLTEGMERERRRIGMDLHDQTLADLARILRMMAQIRSQKQCTDDQLAIVENAVAECLADLRSIVEDMKPGILDVFGFVYATEVLLSPHELSLRKPFKGSVRDLTAGKIDRLAAAIRTPLYRIVQEAINNALTYSTCSTIDVSIDENEVGLVVTIEDDGVGIPPEKIGNAKGGLSHMRTRSKLLGGNLALSRGGSGLGTKVEVSVPFVDALGKGIGI